MKAEAIAKLRAEMAANQNDDMFQEVGEILIDQVESKPDAAEKILAADKSIAKCIDAMEVEARKKPRKNNRAGLSYREGCAIMLKYFGIEAEAPAAKPATPAPKSGFVVNLSDYLK